MNAKKRAHRLHRTSDESYTTRARKKLTQKTEWYRQRKDKVEEDRGKQRSRTIGMRQKDTKGRELRTRTVIFVEQTRDGALAKALREVATRLEGMLGFRVKVVERTGSKLRNSLPNTNPWAGQMKCGRTDCVPCEQESEDNIDCTKRNLVYENICADCNPSAAKKGELKIEDMKKDMPSVYVGETARSLYERGREHWEAWMRIWTVTS